VGIRARTVVRVSGGLTVVLMLALVFFHEALFTLYHLRRLDAEPPYLRAIATATTDTHADRALQRFASHAKGREEIARQGLQWALECLGDTKLATTVLDIREWNEIVLQLTQIEPESTPDDWWISYSAQRAPRRASGSAKAPKALVALFQRWVQIEPGQEAIQHHGPPQFKVRVWREEENRVVISLCRL